MAGDLPSRRIDRDALDRIIRRAAELQAGEIDTGEAITEQELLKLGGDVGIDGRFLRQAMYEEHAGATPEERGLLAKWIGPGRVAAGRVVPGDKTSVEQALEHWMTDSEALTVKRRLPDRTLWERQKGFFAEMKRGLGVGGKSYQLAKAQEVAVAVTQLEAGFCHVELSADISDARAGSATGGGIAAGSLGAVGLAMVAVLAGPPGLVLAVAMVPLGLAAAAMPLVSRGHRRHATRMQLGLEQLLDRLEHGEIKPQHRPLPQGMFAFGRVAEEIRRAITEVSETSRRPPRRLPPSQ